MRRSVAVRGLLLAALLWGAVCLGVNCWRVANVYLPQPWSPESPLQWRAETPPTGNLRTFLQRVDERISAGAPVVFSCPQPTQPESFRCFQWASYWLLPERPTRFAPDAEAVDSTELGTADYLVVYGDPDLADTALGEPVYMTERGAVYEIGETEAR